MKRIGAGAMVLGLLLLLGGGAWDTMFAGLPYQDPPPELAARYALHQAIAGWMGRAGLAALVAGAGLLLLRAGVRRVRAPGEEGQREQAAEERRSGRSP